MSSSAEAGGAAWAAAQKRASRPRLSLRGMGRELTCPIALKSSEESCAKYLICLGASHELNFTQGAVLAGGRPGALAGRGAGSAARGRRARPRPSLGAGFPAAGPLPRDGAARPHARHLGRRKARRAAGGRAAKWLRAARAACWTSSLDAGFARNRELYFCFSEPGAGGNSTALARARLAADASRLEDVKVIFSQQPKVASRNHFGCRIVEAQRRHAVPDAGRTLLAARKTRSGWTTHLGKVVRIRKDGTRAGDNPFVGRAGALPEIWSYGHRNVQGAALAPDGTLWTHEHGPQGGDEINLPQPGRNYGWPVITYGENYGGGKIGEGITARRPAWSSRCTTGCRRSRPRAWPSSPATATAPAGRAASSSARSSSATSTASSSRPARWCASTSCCEGVGARARRAPGPGRLALSAHRRERRQAGAR